LLPDTSIGTAANRAESLRREIQSLEVMYDGQPVHVTASFGVAQHHSSMPDAMSLMKAADAAMYRAKAEGRNRVALSDVPDLATAGVASRALSPDDEIAR
jgi:diguanylate cyclase (GGDEF)-like protein